MTRALFPIKIERLDVSQWIVAHGQLSARTTLRHNWMVTPESPDRVMWTQFNAAPYHGCATNMRYQANHFKLFLSERGRDGRRYSMGPRLEAFSCNPTDGSFAALMRHLAAFTKCLSELFLSY